ncbi:hypothetical protein EB061_13270, partial [bacterium]|nr:hypothetical protein [bacterium]
IPGGTKTLIPVFPNYYAASGSNKVINLSFQVQAGDQINVNAVNTVVYGQGTLGSNQLSMSSIQVGVNGQQIGRGIYGQFTSPQAGALSISFDTQALIGNGWSYSYYQIYFPSNGGVTIGRCVNTSGQPMNCPY